jgi:hypothetical protein
MPQRCDLLQAAGPGPAGANGKKISRLEVLLHRWTIEIGVSTLAHDF